MSAESRRARRGLTQAQMDEAVKIAQRGLLKAEVTSKRSRTAQVVGKIGGMENVPGSMRVIMALAETHYANALDPNRTKDQKAELHGLAIEMYDTFLHNASTMLGVTP